MTNEKYNKRYNPLELSVDEAGEYIQRIPVCLDDALYREFPNSIQTARVLIWLVKKAVNLTYLSGKSEVQVVEISSTELGKYLFISQQRIHECLKNLLKNGWLEKTNTKRNSTGIYLVNFEKIEKSIYTYQMIIKE